MANDATNTFLRPHRSWGMRAYNGLAGAFRGVGWKRPLSVDAVVGAARFRTRLKDWGDESFREPLRRLLEAYERGSDLSPLGRLLLKEECIHYASNRLRMQDELRRHPEILAQPVSRPLFVTGLPRTGTTLLYNLLCQDPRHRPLMTWETLSPQPDPLRHGKRRDPRRRHARRMVAMYQKMVPQSRMVHPLDADGPEECLWLLANTFVSPGFVLHRPIPDYLAWVYSRTTLDLAAVYQDYRRQLQLIQWGGPDARWVTKSPHNLFALDAMQQVFPDGCFVQTHRDPLKVVGSACSLFALERGLHTERLDLQALGPEVVGFLATLLERAERAPDRGRLCHVHYADLMQDPVATVRGIYDHFGHAWDERHEARIRQWLAGNPQHRHGVHRYELEQFGLTREAVEARFGDYRQRHSIAVEAARG